MSPLRRFTRDLAERHPNIIIGALFAYLTLLGAGLGYAVYENHQTSAESHRALCSFRHDLDQRVQAGKDFLRTHPGGIPGISRATIQASLHNQEQTVESLRFIHCQGDTP